MSILQSPSSSIAPTFIAPTLLRREAPIFPPRAAENEVAYALQHEARTAVLSPVLVVVVFAPFVNLPRFVQLEHSTNRKLEREPFAIPVPAVEPLCYHLVAEAEDVEQLELDLFR